MADNEEKKMQARERVKAWREANPERARDAIARSKAKKPEKYIALQKKYHQNNKEAQMRYRAKAKIKYPGRVNEYSAAWRRRHPILRKETVRRYALANQEKLNANDARRRAAKKNAAPAWANKFFIDEIYDLAKRRTKLKTGGHKWCVDHIVPLCSKLVCGLHVESNLQVIPSTENHLKNNRYWPDMPMGERNGR